jgi:hypothetical protein
MDEAELVIRRSQMGKSARSFVTAGPAALDELAAGYWLALSGAPSPDLNVAFVDSGDPTVLAHALRVTEGSGYPSLFVLAGDCRDSDLGGQWQHVGEMPFMIRDLYGDDLRLDSRVRQAGVDDFEVVSQLAAEGFGLDRQVADVVAGLVRRHDSTDKIWLLDVDGQAVSTVLTSTVDDAMCIWCMATPERFGRRGYARALLGDVLVRARTDGVGVGLLGATPAGKPLYDSTGWATLESWRIFTNAGSAQFAAGSGVTADSGRT